MAGFVAGLALAGLAVVALTRGAEDPADGPSPESAAADSCRLVQAFLGVVQRNGPAAEAVAALDRAVERARVAAAADPSWTALSGGVESLRLAVRADDPQAAKVGTAVVREQCRQAGAPLSTG